MKIYVVTSGEYSDYGISAVFLDKDKAETYIRRNKDKYEEWQCEYQIEEYDTYDDNIINTQNEYKTYYRAKIILEDIDYSGYGGGITKKGTLDSDHSQVDVKNKENSFWKKIPSYCIWAYSTKSQEHANKIAIEQYQIETQNSLEEEIMKGI